MVMALRVATIFDETLRVFGEENNIRSSCVRRRGKTGR